MVHPACIGYSLIFTDDAKKDLKRLDKQIISKILEKAKKLVLENNLNVKKLKSKVSLYRLRVGDFRVIYTIKREKIIVYIVAIGHRKDVYNNLNRRLS